MADEKAASRALRDNEAEELAELLVAARQWVWVVVKKGEPPILHSDNDAFEPNSGWLRDQIRRASRATRRAPEQWADLRAAIIALPRVKAVVEERELNHLMINAANAAPLSAERSPRRL